MSALCFIIVVAVLLERMKLMPMPERASKGHVEQVWSLSLTCVYIISLLWLSPCQCPPPVESVSNKNFQKGILRLGWGASNLDL